MVPRNRNGQVLVDAPLEMVGRERPYALRLRRMERGGRASFDETIFVFPPLLPTESLDRTFDPWLFGRPA